MNAKVMEISTDPALLDELRKQAERPTSSNERREQRVSYVYGTMKSDSNITKEAVRNIIANQEG